MKRIRLANSKDIPSLLKLIQPFRSPAFNWSEELYRQEFSHAQTWVLERDGAIAAFVCLRDAVEAWEISILATHEDFQRQGLMRDLLVDLISQFGHHRHLWLEVHESNIKAQALYKSLGFRLDGRRGGYYSDGTAALLFSLPKT